MIRSRTDTLAHHRSHGHPATHTQTQVGVRTQGFPHHSPTIMPLVVGCSVEAWVSEPGPGTRTLLLHVPVRNYIYGVL